MVKKIVKGSELGRNLNFVVRSSIFIFVTLLIGKIMSYLYRIFIGRYYGPEVYGLYTLAISISAWFVVLATLGLTQGLSRYVAFYRGKEENHKIKHIINKSFLFLSVSSLAGGVILFFLSEIISNGIFHDPDLIIFLRIFSIVVPLTVFLNAMLSILQAFEKISWYSFIFNFLLNFIKLSSLAILIFLGFNYYGVLLSHPIAMVLSLVFTFVIYRKYISPKIARVSNKKIEGNLFNELLSYSWPLVLFGIIDGLFFWTDTFMIGYFRTVTEVGLYNAAVPIATILMLISELFMQIFFPIVTKEYSRGNFKLISGLSKQISKWVFIINLPILIFTFVFPQAIIRIFFGSSFIDASNSLRFLIIGYFFLSLFTISTKLISMTGKSRIILFDVIITAILNAILNFFLIPRYGISGAAFATMVSLILSSLLFFIQARKYALVTQLKKDLGKALIAGAIPFALLLFLRTRFEDASIYSILVIFIIFTLLYASLLYLMGCFDKNDYNIVKSIRDKIMR